MQLSTMWEIITRTLKYVLDSRNDNLLTIGGHVLAVPSIERHLVGRLTLLINPSLFMRCNGCSIGGLIDSMGVSGQ